MRSTEFAQIIKVLHGATSDIQWLATSLDLHVTGLLDTYRASLLIAEWWRCFRANGGDLDSTERKRLVSSGVLDGTASGPDAVANMMRRWDMHARLDSHGLRALTRAYLGLDITKSFQRSDWRIRPLPVPMLLYAATDAYVLPTLCERLLVDLAFIASLEGEGGINIMGRWVTVSNRQTLKPVRAQRKRLLYAVHRQPYTPKQ